MPRLHLVVGPVGSGKSTWARRFAADRSALFLEMDAWVTALFGEAPTGFQFLEWYTGCAQRCLPVMWQVAEQVVRSGGEVVLELGFVRRRERESFYLRAARASLALSVVVVDAPWELRFKRVAERNASRSGGPELKVEPAVFRRVSDLWEAPDPEESEERRQQGQLLWIHTGQDPWG